MNLLINDMAQLRQAVSFNGDLAYDQLKPHLRAAQVFLSRYVGTPLLIQLGVAPLTAKQTELLAYVLVPMANLALLKFANVGNVQITDVGVMRTKTANTADAFEWQVERVVATLKAEAYDGIEALLRHLEDNLTDFPAYAETSAFYRRARQLIRSAEVFNRYYEIGSSQLVFETLSSAMLTAEKRLIRPALGPTWQTFLQDEETHEAKLDAARRALAYATIARALREKLVSISDQGVQVNGISQFATIRYQQPANEKQLGLVMAHFDAEATTYLNDLITLITPPILPTGLLVSRVSGGKIVSF